MFLSYAPAMGQVTTANPSPPASGTTSPDWSFSASAYTFFVPDQRDFVSPTFVADHGRLHLQARCNYENLETVVEWQARQLAPH